jgi:cobalt-precorrin 5A hydrolase
MNIIERKTAVITLSGLGLPAARKAVQAFADADLFVHRDVALPHGVRAERFERVVALTAERWTEYRQLVYLMPTGVVTRAIGPCIQHKLKDPAVVVADVYARWIVSLLSGHEGGANLVAHHLANVLDAEPIVTTTTEAERELIVGVGCRKGASADDIINAVQQVLSDCHEDVANVRLLASADIKKDEAGLHEAACQMKLPLRLIASDAIRANTRCETKVYETPSRRVGLPGVAEPTALLAGRRTELLIPRQTINSVTVAVARERSLS